MAGLTVRAVLQNITKTESDAIVVGFFEDERPLKGLAGQLDWLLCGSLSRLLLDNRIRGSLGDTALLTTRGKVPASKVFMVGLGPKSGFSRVALKSAARTAAASVLDAGADDAAIEYLKPFRASGTAEIRSLREGLAEGAGGRSLTVSLLAPDKQTYDELSRLMKA